MEAILPFKIKNEQKFFDSASKVGYNEMEILKFIYVMQQSDLDIFPIMHDERINMLLYGWELCEDYKQNLNPNEWELPEEMETVLKLLVPWSMDIWFSKEWDKSKYFLKTALIHCLNRARDLLMRMPDMMQINWDFLLLYNLKPWNVSYLKNLTVTKDKTLESGAQSIETEELPATEEDIAYVKLEQLPIIVLRLVKFFDQSSIDMVKTLCMRVLAAWNKIHQTELETSGARRPYIPPEDKRCLLLICHIYLMAVYESDDVKGYLIDNMIHNVRFYCQGFQNSTPFHAMDNFEYTPARYIALTNFHLRVQKRDFFDFFIWNKYDTSLVNLFGVVSQAYKSYLLGNLLMELNNMNEDDFASNIPLYKRLMNSYVNEREKSEIFLLNELTKLEHQRYAHNVIQTVKNITDFESKICKGNRMSNIGNYENSDDTVAPLAGTKTEEVSSEIRVEELKDEVIDEDVELEQKRVKESELRLDPVFQNLQNNESMLYYVYDVLAKKDYKGWHFAKVVLLVKLIGHEQNMVETWRYHPGLTTDFMLNLEEKLSHHYVDLAKIFKDHPFLEQEFWLTAFYLNPTSELYEVIKRLGMRNNRKRTDEHTKLVMNIDNIDAKYGLLSSTIDVKELATMSNTDDPANDYDPLFAALHSLRVPDSLIKDMLTAIFLPRNRSFAWAVDWVVLRNRCKMIMTSSKEKKRFVDLNMAEANERLKYLIIDYEKYKNRPQLDYGTIEQGYENLVAGGEFDKDSSEEEEEEEEEDFEDDEDVYESKKRGRGRVSAATRKKEEEEKVEDDNSQEDDPFLMGKRRTRARTAATLASFLFQTLPRSSRRKRNQKSEEDEKISPENDERSSDSKSPITTSETPPIPTPFTGSCEQTENIAPNVPTKNLKECLKERPAFLNRTEGFQNLIDIWNVEKADLQAVDENCVSLMESSTALHIAVKLKMLNREINPVSCDEKEYIDETEMIIHNAEYAIKKECVEDETDERTPITLNENTAAMDVKGNVAINTSEDIHIEQSTAKSSFKLPEETTIEKETRQKANDANLLQALTHAEENSNESLNSDLSIAARKYSSEVSETHTETNSKRNSCSIDIEMTEKLVQTDDLNNKTEIINKSEKLMKASHNIQEATTAQDGKRISDDKKIKPQEEIERAKDANKARKVNKEVDGNEADKQDKRKEETGTTQDENIFDNKADRERETNAEIKVLRGNVLEAEVMQKHRNESKETATEQEAEKTENCKTEEVTTAPRKHQTEKPIQSNSNKPYENKTLESLTTQRGVKKSADLTDDASNTIETEEVIDTNENSKKEENAKQNIENKSVDDKSGNRKDFDDFSDEESKTPLTELKKSLQRNEKEKAKENKAETTACLKIPEKHEEQLDIDKNQVSDEKHSLGHSENLEPQSKKIHKTTTQDVNAEQEKSLSSGSQEAARSFNSQTKLGSVKVEDESNHQAENVENEKEATEASSSKQTKSDGEGTASSQAFSETNQSIFKLLDETSMDSTRSTEIHDSTDSETRELKHLCLRRNVKVLINKLRPCDLANLRQPKVKVQRASYEKYLTEFRPKRRRVEEKVYLEFDESSNSINSCGINSSSSDAYRPPKIKRKIPIKRQSLRQSRTSDSDNDSENSEDIKLSAIISKSRKRRSSSPLSSTYKRVAGPKSARKRIPKSKRRTTGPKSSKQNLIVTPRSASGLKLRISNAEGNRQAAATCSSMPRETIDDEVIQLSSESSDEYVWNDMTDIQEEIIEIDDNPLFEEEIII